MGTAYFRRWWFLGLILLMILGPTGSFGGDLRIQSDTMFRLFERDTAAEEDTSVLPLYQFLQLDGGELEDYGVSYHLYGWGRSDLADSGYFEDQSTGELLYGYLEYRRSANRFGVRFGRQYVFEGVANEAVDGLRLSGDLGNHFSLSVYGGQPVGFETDEGRSGDSIIGGRLAHRYAARYEVGVSFKKSENDGETAEEMLGFDTALFLPADLSLSGFSSYNSQSEDWGEHFYELKVPLGRLVVKPFYRHYSYEDYFGSGSGAVNPFLLLARSGEELTAIGVDALWQFNDNWSFGGKVRRNDYDQLDSSQILSITADWKGDGLTSYGGEFGRTAASDTAGNEYTLVRLYGYSERMGGRLGIDFLSADLLVAMYDQEIYGEDSSVFFSLGGGKRFMDDALSVKLSGDYSQDPYFEEDLRGALTLSYTFAK